MSLTAVTPRAPEPVTDLRLMPARDRAVLEALDFTPMTPGGGPTYTDLFCGAGGSSIGLTEAGLRLVLAANHWRRAIETHGLNFPWAEHLCEDLDRYDMRNLPATDVLWASPICTEASPAGARTGKPKRRPKGQLDLLEQDGHVEQAGFERTRATFYDVMRAAEVHRYKAVIIENVPEVATKWEMFDWWIVGMTDVLGYNVQYVSVSSSHVGDGERNPKAPQWRHRLYLLFTRKGIRLPDVDPRPLAWCDPCGEEVSAFQAWKKPGRRIGKYGHRNQYVHCCPNTGCRHSIVEPYVSPSASIIDWSDLGTRIGDRKVPWKPNTLRRIRAGLDMYGGPITAAVAGNTYERPGSGYVRAWPVSGPLTARTATDGDAVIVPDGAFVIKNKGGYCTPEQNIDRLTDPLSAITGKDTHALVVPYRRGRTMTTAEPLHTVATRDSAALVQADNFEDVLDCRGRMLRPREHLRAQRFPDTYEVRGNPGEQTMQAGNAVSANVAHWLGRAVAAVL